MALHWDNFETRLRDHINEPQNGQVTQAQLVRWANEAIKALPREIQLAKARIVIYFNNDTVTLLEEDWPTTETIGRPTYTYGNEGAFYIRHGYAIDAIHELRQRDTGDDDECGDPIYDYEWMYPQLLPKRQEHVQIYPGTSDYPTHYACYRKWIYVPQVPADNPRPNVEPFEALTVWFDPMFDYSAATDEKWYQIQYRRIMPEINLTLVNVPTEYTQPYFMIDEQYEDLLLLYVKKQVLFQLGDKRYQVASREYDKALRRIKWSLASRANLDVPPRIEDADAHIIRRNRHVVDDSYEYRWWY